MTPTPGVVPFQGTIGALATRSQDRVSDYRVARPWRHARPSFDAEPAEKAGKHQHPAVPPPGAAPPPLRGRGLTPLGTRAKMPRMRRWRSLAVGARCVRMAHGDYARTNIPQRARSKDSSPFSKSSDEKRWVDGALTRKKGLGL